MTANQGEESDSKKSRYKKISNKVKKLLRRAKTLFERGIAQDAKRNPKKFWLHARSKLNTKTGVGPLLFMTTNQKQIYCKSNS